MQLSSVGVNGIETSPSDKYDLAPIRGPGGIMANGFTHAPWLATLHGPEPERHLVIAPCELTDQKL
jgi:hypothetical protein